MNENAKTLIFVGVAAVAALAGYVASTATRPKQAGVLAEDDRPLFPDFKDPLAASRLRIAAVDESTGTLHNFEVANSKGLWSIPSHEDYPADAAKQLEEAASSLMDLKALSVVTDSRAEHELYGVLAPDSKLESGSTGVGKQVTMQDAAGQTLCDFIIGKQEPDQPNIRYVRLPTQDRVYRVKINVGKLSTNFDDWIEKDLLKIDTFDMRRVLVDHYTAQLTQTGVVVDQGEKVQLDYNDKDAKWALTDLAEGEELTTDKVNDLKNSIDQLKIVDVHRKPKGLGRDLRTTLGPDERDREAFASLLSRGFYPLNDGPMLGAAGETQIGNANGVKYVLRFGGLDVAGQRSSAEKKEGDDAEGQDEEPKAGENANRFLLVMAEFDPDFIPKPELKTKELPPLEELLKGKPAVPATPSEEGDNPAANADEAGTPPPAAEAPAEGESNEAAPPKNEDPKAALPNGSGPEGEADSNAAVAKDEEAKDKEQPEPAADEESKDEKDEPAAEDEAKRAADEAQKKAAAEKLRNEQDDDRKIDDYKQKLKKGREKVQELNDRFADWYYVISDSMYHKIQLNRADLVKTKEAEKKPGDEAEDGAAEPGDGEEQPAADKKPAVDIKPAAPPAAAPAKPATPPAKPATPPAKPAAPPAKPK